MSVISMSGYSSKYFSNERRSIKIEIKTVNSRYFDFRLHCPYILNRFENTIKNHIKRYINRGKIDIYIDLKDSSLVSDINVNHDLLKKYMDKFNLLHEKYNIENDIRIIDLISIKGIFDEPSEELDDNFYTKNIEKLIDEVLIDLIEMKKFEGNNIKIFLENCIDSLSENIEKIDFLKKDEIENFEKALRKRLDKIISNVEIEETRLYQEIAYLAEKKDIQEEIVRIRSHIEQFTILLEDKGQKGKKIDFLAQELNREVNTISSKSNLFKIKTIIIGMKSIIEQIREQALNLE